MHKQTNKQLHKQIHNDGYQKMVARLKEARQALGLTQADVARRLGVGPTWVAKVEACELRLDVLHLVMLCRVYRLHAPGMLRMLDDGR